MICMCIIVATSVCKRALLLDRGAFVARSLFLQNILGPFPEFGSVLVRPGIRVALGKFSETSKVFTSGFLLLDFRASCNV